MMGSVAFEKFAVEVVRDYFNSRFSEEKGFSIRNDDVYVVWMCKTLGNNKALLSTTVADGMYYELTYNGAKKEAYLDAYRKLENVVVIYKEDEE